MYDVLIPDVYLLSQCLAECLCLLLWLSLCQRLPLCLWCLCRRFVVARRFRFLS